jgi:hypothetical protein
MNQQVVIKFPWNEGCLAKKLHERLQAVYGATTYALPSVYFCLKEFK